MVILDKNIVTNHRWSILVFILVGFEIRVVSSWRRELSFFAWLVFYCLLCFQVNNIGELLESNLILLLLAVASFRPYMSWYISIFHWLLDREMIQSFVFLFSHWSATCLVNTTLIDSIIEGPEYFIGSNMSWPNYCSPNADRKDTY